MNDAAVDGFWIDSNWESTGEAPLADTLASIMDSAPSDEQLHALKKESDQLQMILDRRKVTLVTVRPLEREAALWPHRADLCLEFDLPVRFHGGKSRHGFPDLPYGVLMEAERRSGTWGPSGV